MGDVIELGPAKLKAMLADVVEDRDLPEATKKRVVEELLPLLESMDLSQPNPTFSVSLPAGTYDRAEFDETLSHLVKDCQKRFHLPLLALVLHLQEKVILLSDELDEAKEAKNAGRITVAQESPGTPHPSPPDVATLPRSTEQNALELLRLDVERGRAAGKSTFSADEILEHVTLLQRVALERSPAFLEAVLLERWRVEREVFVAKGKQAADSAIEDFRIVNANGELAVKAAMTINGGGAIAVLAFVGHLVSNNPAVGLVSRFAAPLSFFVGGVLASAAAYGLRYLTQYAYSRRWKAWGHGSNIASILATTGSLAAFGWAARALYLIFRSL